MKRYVSILAAMLILAFVPETKVNAATNPIKSSVESGFHQLLHIITYIKTPNGSVLAGTSSGMWIYRNNQWSQVGGQNSPLAGGYIDSVAVSSQGSYLAHDYTSGSEWLYKNGRWSMLPWLYRSFPSLYGSSQTVYFTPTGVPLVSMSVAEATSILFEFIHGEWVKFGGASFWKKWNVFSKPFYITDVLFDRAGTLYVSTDGEGVWAYGKTGWRSVGPEKSGFAQSRITELYISRNKFLFAGGEDGLYKYERAKWIPVPSPMTVPLNSNTSHYVNAIFTSKSGNLEIAGDKGIYEETSRGWKSISKSNSQYAIPVGNAIWTNRGFGFYLPLSYANNRFSIIPGTIGYQPIIFGGELWNTNALFSQYICLTGPRAGSVINTPLTADGLQTINYYNKTGFVISESNGSSLLFYKSINGRHWSSLARPLGAYVGNGSIFSLHYVKDNNIYVSTTYNLYHWSGGKWAEIHWPNIQGEIIVGMESFGPGKILLITNQRILEFDGSKFTAITNTYAPDDGNNGPDIAIDPTLNIIASIVSTSLKSGIFPNTIEKFQNGTTQQIAGPGPQLSAVVIAPSGSLIVGTDGEGIWNYKNGMWTQIGKGNKALSHLNVKSMSLDSNGVLVVNSSQGVWLYNSAH